MAYQQQGGMNPGGPGVAPDHHGPQGAEYTLQGAYCKSLLLYQRLTAFVMQESCAFSRWNGTTTNALETLGILSAQR